jgi:hypothetical protein
MYYRISEDFSHILSLERTGGARGLARKVVRCELVEKMAVVHAPAAQLKTVMRLSHFSSINDIRRANDVFKL